MAERLHVIAQRRLRTEEVTDEIVPERAVEVDRPLACEERLQPGRLDVGHLPAIGALQSVDGAPERRTVRRNPSR